MKIQPDILPNDFSSSHPYFHFPLHPFQQWAVRAIDLEQDVLICAPTGSGKTLPATYAIHFFTHSSLEHQIIYTTPIKALSNEKFHQLQTQFPDVSVGLITGDIQVNPTAQVIVMTTEILLHQIKAHALSDHLRCVVFDEIHMINDAHRGHVWEQTIMLLPPSIRLIGLSATLHKPLEFAAWLETRIAREAKEVWVSLLDKRPVPLRHYAFLAFPSHKDLHKDKEHIEVFEKTYGRLHLLQNECNVFTEARAHTVWKWIRKTSPLVSRADLLNRLCTELKEKEWLPALCFVFSKKEVEMCARQLTANVQAFDTKTPYIIEQVCESILRRLPNFREYLHLPEYVQLVQWLGKGIGIHHAGMMPVLRELVELMFAQGHIQILFCTETMSVGINLPVKTCIFTNVIKPSEAFHRRLHRFEYTQAAGRAGRLGLDAVGNVIHLVQLYDTTTVTVSSMADMMHPEAGATITSKFTLTPSFVLHAISNHLSFHEAMEGSMWQRDLINQTAGIRKLKEQAIAEERTFHNHVQLHMKTPMNILHKYMNIPSNKQSQRKQMERDYRHIASDAKSFQEWSRLQHEVAQLEVQCRNSEVFAEEQWKDMITYLIRHGCLLLEDDTHTVTRRGTLVQCFHEVDGIAFAEWMDSSLMDEWSVDTWTLFLQAFVWQHVREEDECEEDDHCPAWKQCVQQYKQKAFQATPVTCQHTICVTQWVKAACEEDAKRVLEEYHTGSLGEFVKAMLKCVQLANEVCNAATMLEKWTIKEHMQTIPSLLLKFVKKQRINTYDIRCYFTQRELEEPTRKGTKPTLLEHVEYSLTLNTDPLQCKQETTPNMVHKKSQQCRFDGCSKQASFNFSNETIRLYCKQHAMEGMVNVVSKKCQHDGCSKQPIFNYSHETTGLYCKQHFITGMVDVKNKTCQHDGCSKIPKFNYSHKKKGLYCKQHFITGMVNVVSKKCQHDGCSKQPYFNYSNQNTGLYCKQHLIIGMVNVVSKKCQHDGCSKRPYFNYSHETTGVYCKQHIMEGMVDVVSTKCQHDGCSKIPNFNYSHETKGVYCKQHAEKGMVDVTHKTCKTDICDVRVNNNAYRGFCLSCFRMQFPDEPKVRNYRIKEKAVHTFLTTAFAEWSWRWNKTMVGGSSMHRPDFLLDVQSHVLIIEVDEYGHNTYDPLAEKMRLMKLSENIGGRPLVVVRFNPDDYVTNDGRKVTTCWGKDQEGKLRIKPSKVKEWNSRLAELEQVVKGWTIKNHTEEIECIHIISLFCSM